MYSASLTGTGAAAFLNFTLVWFIIFPRVEQTLYSVFGWKGLNTRQACQLFRSVRDMRRRRLAQLLIHDLDIAMKTDKSLLLPPVQSLQGCLNSRPGSHQPLKTNVFRRGSIFQPVLSSILSQLMMSYACRIKQMVALEPGGANVGLRGRRCTGCTCSKSFRSQLYFHPAFKRFLVPHPPERTQFRAKPKRRRTCHVPLRAEEEGLCITPPRGPAGAGPHSVEHRHAALSVLPERTDIEVMALRRNE